MIPENLLVNILDNDDTLFGNTPDLLEKALNTINVVKHSDENGHIKALVLKGNAATVIDDHISHGIGRLDDIDDSVSVAPLLQRVLVEAPTPTKVQDFAALRNVVLKHGGDILRTLLECVPVGVSDQEILGGALCVLDPSVHGVLDLLTDANFRLSLGGSGHSSGEKKDGGFLPKKRAGRHNIRLELQSPK